MEKKLRFNSATIHGGQTPDPAYGAVMPPIYQTSTYAQTPLGGIKDLSTAVPIIPPVKPLKNLWQVLKTENTA